MCTFQVTHGLRIGTGNAFEIDFKSFARIEVPGAVTVGIGSFDHLQRARQRCQPNFFLLRGQFREGPFVAIRSAGDDTGLVEYEINRRAVQPEVTATAAVYENAPAPRSRAM